MRCTARNHSRTAGIFTAVIIWSASLAFAQSELQKRTLVINGRSGEALIYRIDNQSFIDLESLARIAHGSVSFQGDQITLTLPVTTSTESGTATRAGMTPSFMAAAVQGVAAIKEWHTTIADAIERGVPGNGSRLVIYHDRAAEKLRLATINVSSDQDRQAAQLLSNHFKQVDHWKSKLVDARKSMNTGNYSITPDALQKDAEYQKIASCAQFLGTMLPGGQYKDDPSCH